MKVRIKATKMTDPTVEHISLVERGANRSPFKVIKQEPTMSKAFAGIDIGGFFTRKSEKKQPEVFGVVTMKSEQADLTPHVEAAGFAVGEVIENEDASVVFKQGELDSNPTVVRLTDKVAVVLKHAKLHDMDIQVGEKTFKQEVETQGFYPSIDEVMNGLSESAYTIIEKAESQEQAATMVAKMFTEAGRYVESLVQNLPAKAFKLEQVIKAYKPKEEKKPMAEGESCDDKDHAKKDETEEKPAETTPEVTPEEKPAEPVAKSEQEEKPAAETPEKSLTTAEVSSIVAAQVEGVQQALIAKMGDLFGTLTQTVQKSADAVDSKISALTAQVSEAKELAVKAESAVAGAVVGGSDREDHQPVRKSEMRAVGREIDTAFNPGARTRRR